MISKVFRILLLLPITYWGYLIFFGDLGADPAKKLNHLTGEIALYYLIFNLLVGILISVSFRFPKQLRFLLTSRRYLGVLTFQFLIFHVLLYLLMEGFQLSGFEQIVTKAYLIFGALAWIIFSILALTSNDYFVRRLGPKKWKLLHRTIYFASLFVTVHILSIEKADLVKYGLILGGLWLLQIMRLIRNRKSVSFKL